jgi:hypothetical protein
MVSLHFHISIFVSDPCCSRYPPCASRDSQLSFIAIASTPKTLPLQKAPAGQSDAGSCWHLCGRRADKIAITCVSVSDCEPLSRIGADSLLVDQNFFCYRLSVTMHSLELFPIAPRPYRS